jgi:uncharacterized protein (DUF2252 family)
MDVVYRIRYCDAQGLHQHEVLIEAHNTTEALVKFCHARGAQPGASLISTRVSIWPEQAEEVLVGPQSASPQY